MALISGVMPGRSRDQISSGRVLSFTGDKNLGQETVRIAVAVRSYPCQRCGTACRRADSSVPSCELRDSEHSVAPEIRGL